MSGICFLVPPTTEQVESAVVHSVYGYAAAAKKRGQRVRIIQGVLASNVQQKLHRVPWDWQIAVDVSSIPQVDHAQAIVDHCMREGRMVGCLGLQGTIDAFRLPHLPGFTTEEFGQGMLSMHSIHCSIGQNALSQDLDSHIITDDQRRWTSMFLSVGCRKRCHFCYTTAGEYPHAFATPGQIRDAINFAKRKNTNIHFMDEDLFAHPDLDLILAMLERSGLRWIAMSTSERLSQYLTCTPRPVERLKRSGLVCLEVGLEGLDSKVTKKHQTLEPIQAVTDRSLPACDHLPVFWLTMTYFEGDSLAHIRATGDFLARYGFEPYEMLPRIRTNANRLGLGQFAMRYHGTRMWTTTAETCIHFTERPTRLLPSMIGRDLWNTRVMARPDAMPRDFDQAALMYTGVDHMREFWLRVNHEGPLHFNQLVRTPWDAVAMALLARVGAVVEA